MILFAQKWKQYPIPSCVEEDSVCLFNREKTRATFPLTGGENNMKSHGGIHDSGKKAPYFPPSCLCDLLKGDYIIQPLSIRAIIGPYNTHLMELLQNIYNLQTFKLFRHEHV